MGLETLWSTTTEVDPNFAINLFLLVFAEAYNFKARHLTWLLKCLSAFEGGVVAEDATNHMTPLLSSSET